MKKIFLSLAILIFAFISDAEAQSGFTIFGGLSTPSDNINQVYNEKSSIATVLRDAPGLGYHLGLRARFPLGEDLMLSGGISLQKFPETNIKVTDPSTGKTHEFSTFQNIIPVAVGLDYSLFRSLVGAYLTGELTYNYITNTMEYQLGESKATFVPLGIDIRDEDSRIGAGLGVGAFVDLKVTSVNLEAKYNFANLIGKKENEPDKSYLTVSLGIAFGGFGF